MPLSPELLDQVLNTPAHQDVTRSPIVTAVILMDPDNAGAVTPALDDHRAGRVDNARQILAQFGPEAVLPFLSALGAARADTRQDALSLLAAMLALEDAPVVNATLRRAAGPLDDLLTDTRSVPVDEDAPAEQDFRGRVCDHVYLTVQALLRPTAEQSVFRAGDEVRRDQLIGALRRHLGGAGIV